MPQTRRAFLQTASALGLAAPAFAEPLPTVPLGPHRITRLIVGSNPFYGFSHFNRILDTHMREWYTQERVLEVLNRCSRAGINTWQLHYGDRSMSDMARYRESGGGLQRILLADGELMKRPELLPEAAKHKPLAVVHHGGWTDRRFRDGETGLIHDFLKRVRDAGVLVGMSTHNPATIEFAEEKGWDVDFYMTCFYRVTRTPEETIREFGEAPLGETYMQKDPERMTRVIRQTRKTCLAFKILAAGRLINTPQSVDQAFDYAFRNIKPQDAVIVGMYPRFRDEVEENAARARRFGGQV